MNIDDMKFGDLKKIAAMFSDNTEKSESLNGMIGKKVIVRTYSAGVWFGELSEKSVNEVILINARRMYYWKAKESISLSACAIYGVATESKIVSAVDSVWLEAIEIIPCTEDAIKSLEGAPNAKAI